ASLLHRREGPFHGALKDGYDDLVEHPYTALDQIEMAIRQRVERPRIERDCHYPSSLSVAAGPALARPYAPCARRAEGIVAWLSWSVNRLVVRSSNRNCPHAAEISRPRLCRTKAESPCCSRWF